MDIGYSIFDPDYPGEPVPEGFNGVVVALDARVRSDLNWQSALDIADSYIAQGMTILWDLDFGLFDRLPSPIDSEAQFLTLSLAIDHFHSQVWEKYCEQSLGAILYRGSADFSVSFPWDEQQNSEYDAWLDEENEVESQKMRQIYCSRVCCDYLSLLRDRFFDDCEGFCLLEAGTLDPDSLLPILSSGHGRIHFVFRGADFLCSEYVWEGGKATKGVIGRRRIPLTDLYSIKKAICLPHGGENLQDAYRMLAEPIRELVGSQTPFRFIAEERLTQEWDGLDELIVVGPTLTPLAKRKLQGFSAAGGTILTIN